MEQAIRFCRMSNGARIAYTVLGHGSLLVCPPGSLSHLELSWEDPPYRAFMLALARHHQIVLYDRYGCGLSDRDRTDYSFEPEVEALQAVVDHLSLKRFALFAPSGAGLVAAAYAADHPDVVSRIILYGTGRGAGLPEDWDEITRSVQALIRAHWGLGSRTLADLFIPAADSATRDRFARFQREAATADAAAEMMWLRADVSDAMRRIRAPTLVLHRRQDTLIPFELGREAATLIPNAQFGQLEGESHLPWLGDSGEVLRRIASFLGDPAEASEPGASSHSAPPARDATHEHGYPDGLSRREVEVLRLLAAGKSNRQIADELVISLNTVPKHVSHIYAKTGTANRAEAAGYAHARGLLKA
jgi:pimeloyl-ACP methyl ester carboxylesterase/DNA-binding CsgD family transcriptional regulator